MKGLSCPKSGLVLWLHADDLAGVPDQQPIFGWKDRSSAQNDVVVLASDQPPLYDQVDVPFNRLLVDYRSKVQLTKPLATRGDFLLLAVGQSVQFVGLNEQCTFGGGPQEFQPATLRVDGQFFQSDTTTTGVASTPPGLVANVRQVWGARRVGGTLSYYQNTDAQTFDGGAPTVLSFDPPFSVWGLTHILGVGTSYLYELRFYLGTYVDAEVNGFISEMIGTWAVPDLVIPMP